MMAILYIVFYREIFKKSILVLLPEYINFTDILEMIDLDLQLIIGSITETFRITI